MRFDTLQQWLDWQETLHPRKIDLSLDRVRVVADALALRERAPVTVVVGGTNGKGTVATMVAALLKALGLRVGLYTSPHLLRYNERVVVDGVPASDSDLCRAFAAVDMARGTCPLTYFEFGTLAAGWLFRERGVDFQVLEVGLGGRLDAVNLWDADVAAITCVDLDHQAWLGDDREQIGLEKAGIMRAGRPVALGEETPPASVLEAALGLGVPVFRLGQDYRLVPDGAGGRWCWADTTMHLGLHPGECERLEGARGRNAATALAVLHLLGLQRQLTADAVRAGLGTSPPARLQRLPGNPEWLLDVAHNPQSARELSGWLAGHPVSGPVVAIVAVMADKERGPIFEALQGQVNVWIPIDIPGARALPASALSRELEGLPGSRVVAAGDPAGAIAAASAAAGPGGRVVVFGSFMTVQAVLESLDPAGAQALTG
ncbi:bifunctional folylpolyglutamate synthase/dihydrofolate synthase [Thioalkalivibrio sp.]|uniref:bifunctional folylpolyglutamate synthase/dihydrofolate synthase n=1 Tax=Thioalkalivibrio sp. TaxID=2093813 RepID=UPI0035681703